MVNVKMFGLVYTIKCKGWAGYFGWAAGAANQAAHKGGFAATQIGSQFNNFAAVQLATQQFAEPFGGDGTGRARLPDHDGTHSPRIVARPNR